MKQMKDSIIVSMRLPRDLWYRECDLIAKAKGLSKSGLVRQALETEVARHVREGSQPVANPGTRDRPNPKEVAKAKRKRGETVKVPLRPFGRVFKP